LGSAGYEKLVAAQSLTRVLADLGEWEVVRIADRLEVRLIGSSADTENGNGNGAGNGTVETADNGNETDPRKAVRAAVARLRHERKEVSLQVLGDTLQSSMGRAAYESFIDPKRLKGTIEGLGEWKLTEVRPSIVTVEPLAGDAALAAEVAALDDGAAPASPLTPEQAGLLIEELREALQGTGKSLTPQLVGSHLQKATGEDAYRAFVGSEGLVRTLERLDLWEASGGETKS
jgi:hypothetical protein